MKIEKPYEALVIGAILYCCQASQSIVRAVPHQLDELRQFYAQRPNPRELAQKIWTYAGRHQNAKRIFAASFRRKIREASDLYMLNRLLLDFSYLLEGHMSAEDAGNLRYCMALLESRLINSLSGFPRKSAGQLNIFNYNGDLPSPIEIEDIVGKSWREIEVSPTSP